MPDVILYRESSNDQGTFGTLICKDAGLQIRILELPDRNNEARMSRIPAGKYKVVPFNSPKFGRCWMVTGVPHRSYVLFHKGNLAGDTRQGWKTHSHGCLLTHTYRGRLGRQTAGLNAQRAFSEMRSKIGLNATFNLIIIELC